MKPSIAGQIHLFDYLRKFPDVSWDGCGNCICQHCLYYKHWGRSCPYGECFDSKRAKDNPYDKAHKNEPPRTSWSDWEKDQAYWCRGGKHYPVYNCDEFVKYKGVKFEECIMSNIMVYQDGYKHCGFGANPDCERCYEYLIEKIEKQESQEVTPNRSKHD